MKQNNMTNWVKGVNKVQFQKNARYHSGIGRSPYEAVYGKKPKCGLRSLNLPDQIIEQITCEEDLLEVLNAKITEIR